jgi:hypothetical protein
VSSVADGSQSDGNVAVISDGAPLESQLCSISDFGSKRCAQFSKLDSGSVYISLEKEDVFSQGTLSSPDFVEVTDRGSMWRARS